MSISKKDKDAFEAFKVLCQKIKESTSGLKLNESSKDQEARIQKALSDYRFFFEYYFPHYAAAPCADFHVREAMRAKKNPFYQAAWVWFRGAAKSVHSNIGLPVFLKQDNQLFFMALVGDNEDKACKLLGSLQAEFSENQRLIHDFGKQFSYGSWADGEFMTNDNVSFYALGIGQSPRGLRQRANRPDYIVVDDVDTRDRCKNPRRVQEAAEWVMEDLMGCFGGTRERFIVANNFINKTSVLGRLKEELPKLSWIQVDAIDKKGNPAWPQRYPKEYWKEKQEGLPMRSFQREYMNNPIEEGTIFKTDWVKWKKLPDLKKYDDLVVYCDPSFKNTRNSDFKAIRFWGKLGSELHLIKCFVRQTTVNSMVTWFYDLHESLPQGVIVRYFIEANMLQDLLLDEFTTEGEKRGYQLPIRPDKRSKEDKFQRVEATSPLYERGFVYYNEDMKNDPDMNAGLSQLLAFEKGGNAPDDAPDADEGAIFLLQQRSREAAFVPRIGPRAKPRNAY